MHPSVHAINQPDKPAVIIAETGEIITYHALDGRSNQIAQLFCSLGLEVGDTVAMCLDNCARFFEVAWAAQRSGLCFVCISSKLTVSEVEYIFKDCGAKLLVTSARIGSVASELPKLLSGARLFCVGEQLEGYQSLDAAISTMPMTPIAGETAGMAMLYSSGTTGRPKGVRGAQPANKAITTPSAYDGLAKALWGFDEGCIYLSPAPLYHAAPLAACMSLHKAGGTVVMMEKFDAEAALHHIERYQITHSQWVPTHFVRMLKLPEAVRHRHDLTSLKLIIHAAAPCPVPVKEAMIAWFGPILHEYYAGTEANGFTAITSAEWLAHKGSVGKSMLGTLRICDDAGEPLPPRSEGLIYVEGGSGFEYHNDPAKTSESRNRYGWTTLGDIGWLDEEGYLYLTDRKSFMIISGGVNIYPQEIENHLITHPKVLDVAVIGAPDPEMGEKVVAIIQPVDWQDAGDALATELMIYARHSLSSVKLPRQIDFMAELPRLPTGKLYKKGLRDSYWSSQK